MSLEKSTEDKAMKKKQKNRRGIQRPLLGLFGLVVVALLIFFGRNFVHQNTVSEYDFAQKFKDFYVSDSAYVQPFASDLAVIKETQEDGQFAPKSAVLSPQDGGDVIFAKDARAHMNPASTTKIMTAILALKYGNLSDSVTVGNEVVITEPGASLAKLKPGDTLTMEQLVYGLMLPSGNDAANAIAIHMAGSIDAFVEMMNKEAKEIGAVDTHFVNANGLTNPDHYTSAYDLYLMFHEGLKIPKFKKITGTKTYVANYKQANGSSKSVTWANGNQFISNESPQPNGITVFAGKTGTTLAAGNCLVAAAKSDNGKEYIAVVLNAKTKPILYDNMARLFEKAIQ